MPFPALQLKALWFQVMLSMNVETITTPLSPMSLAPSTVQGLKEQLENFARGNHTI